MSDDSSVQVVRCNCPAQYMLDPALGDHYPTCRYRRSNEAVTLGDGAKVTLAQLDLMVSWLRRDLKINPGS